jgi:membrane fusion protein, heavy metal efflux system
MRSESSSETFMALLFAACILLALVLLTACGAKDAEPAEARPTVEGATVVFPVKAAVAERLAVDKVQPPMERTLQLPGRLVWDEERTVRVFPPFAGRVTRLLAKPGDRVAQGQPLAEMASPDFGQAEADARKARADLALAQKTLERQRELAAHGVAAAKDVQQAEADEARTRAEADRTSQRLKAYGHVEGADGSSFLLRSPVAGTVVERNLNPGQEVRPDQPGAPLFVVTDPTRLWAQLDANEADARELRQVADFVDPSTRTVKLRGEVPNASRQLRAEMFVTARVKLPAGEFPSVDARGVYLSGVRRFVFVRDGPGRYTRRPVRVGSEIDGRMPVFSGVKEGEEVVVAGMLFLEQIVAAKAS